MTRKRPGPKQVLSGPVREHETGAALPARTAGYPSMNMEFGTVPGLGLQPVTLGA
jgi:hypothetical protein